jgi:biopolymer transport protein ExbD
MRRLILVVVVLVSAVAVFTFRGAKREGAMPSLDSPYVKIWVSKTGEVTVDGQPAEVSTIGATLAKLAQKKGVVLYGREAAGEQPHPKAMEVMNLVIGKRLPIRMSTKPDFSDAVGPDGKLLP